MSRLRPILVAFAFAAGSATTPTYSTALAPVTMTFDGQVGNIPSWGVMLRRYVPGTGYITDAVPGLKPNAVHAPGDAVSFSVTATLPTPAALASGAFAGNRQADGTYLFDLSGSGAGSAQAGAITDFTVSGSFEAVAGKSASFALQDMAVEMDPERGTMALIMAGKGGEEPGVVPSTFTGPDIDEPIVAAPPPVMAEAAPETGGDLLAGIGFTSKPLVPPAPAQTVAAEPIIPPPPAQVVEAIVPPPPAQVVTREETPGGPTPVPAPGMALLFGGAFAALALRRRKAAA